MPRPVRQPLPVVAVCLLVVALLGLVVRGENAVTRWDADVVADVAADRSPAVVDLARALTNLGDGLWLGIALLLAGAALVGLRRLRPAAAFAPALSLALGAAVTPLLKALFERPRPPVALHEVVERSSGFPSGHSTQSAAGWLALGLVLAYAGTRTDAPERGEGDGAGRDGPGTTTIAGAGTARPDRTPVVGPGRDGAVVRGPGPVWPRAGRRPLVAAVLLVGVAGLSRVVLSVHSPTDVLSGWLVGTACAVTVVGLLLRRDR